ncbi:MULTISPECIES: SCO6880 family protein [Corynebacterium]|uniref:SCO6880 family protein n=1 Tax=Corynebacterium TaxID=1716 RepID=UPI00124EB9DA|nr:MULTISPECIES: SCO6880 family protein [Corynebacterium]
MDEPIQYSLGQPPQRTGLGGFSLKATIVVATGFLGFLLLQLMGLGKIGFTVVLPVTGVVAVLISVRWSSRTVAEMSQILVADARRKRRKEASYFAGGLSRVPGGRYRLPGLLARTESMHGVDADGREFVAVLDRPRREATVFLDCQLTGQTAMTQTERNAMTAEWSRWLAMLSLSGDIVSAAVVVSTRPGSGQLVEKEVNSIVVDSAAPIARRVMAEAAEYLGVQVPEVEAHIAITVKFDSEVVADGSFISQLSTRLPGWYTSLGWAGVIAEPMDEDTLVSRIHGFYNPDSEYPFESLRVAGEPHGMEWDDAGPAAAFTSRNAYLHDGWHSVTWEMREAPRSTFEDQLLTGLIAPHPRVERKRVCLVYRPFEAGAGASRVEQEHRDAMVAANSSKKITSAKAEMRLEHTEAARRAQARGAQLGRYSLFVTATTKDEHVLARIRHDVEQLGAGASIRLASMDRQQDTGFAVSCGAGQVPWGKETTSQMASA